MSIDSLSIEGSPRLTGVDPGHVQLLLASDAETSPVLVHRRTMRVIDGVHRVQAALARGRREIAVRFFDGSEADAFVLAVQSNVRHGLPLSLSDRTAAAARIMESHPQWSDRAIARVSGLSPKTVAAVRRRSTEDLPQSNTRMGTDGRVRAMNAAEGRRLAGQMIEAHPGASLREVAKAAGISVSTAHDVRERLRAGDDPVPARSRRKKVAPAEAAGPDGVVSRVADVTPMRPAGPRLVHGGDRGPNHLHVLRKDPSLRFTENGRALLRLFDTRTQFEEMRNRLVECVPPHCRDLVVALADDYGRFWQEFASELRIAHDSGEGPEGERTAEN
ncbi:ParB/RepB/Spo0J family partition protein [Streptomyces sulfonofaciens]|uniref:ParB/RepB/Spo0J family partition protein n=1 Tax=Streptomyces sulfonofaciens TaxID=68272 RepID=UPI001E4C1D9E|nr:ParB/RepB/Spo0J family partition protein [Streptomyces sulfonofaciens]